jgi:hypothetical protein
MTDLQRIDKVLKWLVFVGFADNNMEIAVKLGYTKSSFSQIINGKVPLSDKFTDKLSSANLNINKLWILYENGQMLKNNASWFDGAIYEIAESEFPLVDVLESEVQLLKDKICVLSEKLQYQTELNVKLLLERTNLPLPSSHRDTG